MVVLPHIPETHVYLPETRHFKYIKFVLSSRLLGPANELGSHVNVPKRHLFRFEGILTNNLMSSS